MPAPVIFKSLLKELTDILSRSENNESDCVADEESEQDIKEESIKKKKRKKKKRKKKEKEAAEHNKQVLREQQERERQEQEQQKQKQQERKSILDKTFEPAQRPVTPISDSEDDLYNKMEKFTRLPDDGIEAYSRDI